MTCNPEQVAVQVPRNVKQLPNLRFKHLHQTRISLDALYNIHELAYDIPGFMWRITTFPDLLCICGLHVSTHMYIYSLSYPHRYKCMSTCSFINVHVHVSALFSRD